MREQFSPAAPVSTRREDGDDAFLGDRSLAQDARRPRRGADVDDSRWNATSYRPVVEDQ
jgi:hypothetical protein